MEDWRERLDRLLSLRGISHDDLARKAGIARSHITMLVNKKRKDTGFKRAQAIANALEVSLDWLATGQQWTPEDVMPEERDLLMCLRQLPEQQKLAVYRMAKDLAEATQDK